MLFLLTLGKERSAFPHVTRLGYGTTCKNNSIFVKYSPHIHHYLHFQHHEVVWQETAEKSLRKHCPYQQPLLTYAKKRQATDEEITNALCTVCKTQLSCGVFWKDEVWLNSHMHNVKIKIMEHNQPLLFVLGL